MTVFITSVGFDANLSGRCRTFLVEPDKQDDAATEVGGGSVSNNFSDRLLAVVQDMDKQIQELEAALASSPSELGELLGDPSAAANSTLKKKKSVAHLKPSSKKEEKDKDSQHRHGKGEHGILGLFHRRSKPSFRSFALARH